MYKNVEHLEVVTYQGENEDFDRGVSFVLEKLDAIPIADVAEVRHGYWIDKPTGRYSHMGSWCSVCQEKSGIGGIESNRHKPYCPNCGAKMHEKCELCINSRCVVSENGTHHVCCLSAKQSVDCITGKKDHSVILKNTEDKT